MSAPQASTASRGMTWTVRATAIAAVSVVVWVCATQWGGVVHGHPGYAVLLGVTTLGSIAALVSAGTREHRRGRWRALGRVALVLAALVGIAVVGWLRPHTALDTSLAAMNSDSRVTVAETATSISFTPRRSDGSGVFFQPGALVDARAYAALLRPLAEAGHTVVIAKQPLGIAFLAPGAFDAARSGHADVTTWVVGGHSLGGTVAAQTAATNDAASGLLLFASYPASDMSEIAIPVLSISATADGLATTAKIDASRANLPDDTVFTAIAGASHAQFGDYGAQAGDGKPTIGDDETRVQAVAAALAFVAEVSE